MQTFMDKILDFKLKTNKIYENLHRKWKQNKNYRVIFFWI